MDNTSITKAVSGSQDVLVSDETSLAKVRFIVWHKQLKGCHPRDKLCGIYTIYYGLNLKCKKQNDRYISNSLSLLRNNILPNYHDPIIEKPILKIYVHVHKTYMSLKINTYPLTSWKSAFPHVGYFAICLS